GSRTNSLSLEFVVEGLVAPLPIPPPLWNQVPPGSQAAILNHGRSREPRIADAEAETADLRRRRAQLAHDPPVIPPPGPPPPTPPPRRPPPPHPAATTGGGPPDKRGGGGVPAPAGPATHPQKPPPPPEPAVPRPTRPPPPFPPPADRLPTRRGEHHHAPCAQ